MRMQSKRTTEESTDRGVSPVIGVILMVAITVILAAVIAAFVLDIGPGETDPQATISSDHDVDGGEITVELQSLDGTADAVVVVEENGDDLSDIDGDGEKYLTVAGQEETFDGDVNGGSIQAISVSDTDDLDDGSITEIDEVENNAILENLDDD